MFRGFGFVSSGQLLLCFLLWNILVPNGFLVQMQQRCLPVRTVGFLTLACFISLVFDGF